MSEFARLSDVSQQLHALSDQFVHSPDNVFAQMAARVDKAREQIADLNQTLTVPAAEYVPAIQDAFDILDELCDFDHRGGR